MPTLNGDEILTSLRRRLPELLPTLRVVPEPPSRKGAADLVLRLRAAGKTWRLVCEVKSVGEPRYLAQAITTLRLAIRNASRSYPVVVAPYIAPEGQRLCKEADVGYLDLAGNAYLRFDGILVDRRSGAPPPRAKARLRRLFSPRSSRILRVLLEQPSQTWTSPSKRKPTWTSGARRSRSRNPANCWTSGPRTTGWRPTARTRSTPSFGIFGSSRSG